MSHKTFCKALIAMMFIELSCVILVPAVRTSKGAGFTVSMLVVGIGLTASYLRLRSNHKLSFLARPGPARFFFSLILCTPAASLAWTACDDVYERQLPAFGDSIHRIEASDIANRSLGKPLRIGWPVEGTYDESHGIGHRTMAIPISGDRAQGSLLVVGENANGVWKVKELTLVSRDGSVSENLLTDRPR